MHPDSETVENESATNSYYLLPFKFRRLNNQELIVNEFGDYLIVPEGSVEKIVYRRIHKRENESLYSDLIANYFISESPIPKSLEIMATRYRTKKSFLDHFTGLHIIVPTLRCNHGCHYCQVSRVPLDKVGYEMSYEIIDVMVDVIFQSPNPHVTLEFQGGEPLLAFDKIRYTIEKANEYIKTNSKKLTNVICTNLSFLNDEILEFCKTNNVLISTSLDGPEFIHNHNRKFPNANSYKTTIENINRCREVLGYDSVSALMTTTKLSLLHPQEIIDEYIAQGFREIFLRMINPYGFALRSTDENNYTVEEFFEFYKKALTYLLDINRKGTYFVEVFTKLLLSKILTPFPIGFVDLQSPAGIINNVIIYNYNGKVYPSDEARMLAEMGDEFFFLGTLGKNSYREIFFGEKAKEISEYWSNENLAGCSDCAFQVYCGADPIRNYTVQGNMYGFRPSSSFCRKNTLIIEHLLSLMAANPEVEEIFNCWVSNTEI